MKDRVRGNPPAAQRLLKRETYDAPAWATYGADLLQHKRSGWFAVSWWFYGDPVLDHPNVERLVSQWYRDPLARFCNELTCGRYRSGYPNPMAGHFAGITDYDEAQHLHDIIVTLMVAPRRALTNQLWDVYIINARDEHYLKPHEFAAIHAA